MTDLFFMLNSFFLLLFGNIKIYISLSSKKGKIREFSSYFILAFSEEIFFSELYLFH